jgi:hypothetical protein
VPASVGNLAWFDLHPEGRRFAVLRAAEEIEERRDHVILIQNFFAELHRTAQPAKH